jgi:hypothetical protein
MKRTVLGIMTAVIALGASSTVAQAQSPMTFGIAAGASIPTGDAADFVETGFHGILTLGVRPAMMPFGMRIDGMFNSLAADDAFGDGDLRILGLSANAVLAMPATVTSPYLIGGLGFYNTKFNSDDPLLDSDSESNFGLNIGVGAQFNLSGFGTFAEIRYHNIFDGEDDFGNTAFIPITFGIMF